VMWNMIIDRKPPDIWFPTSSRIPVGSCHIIRGKDARRNIHNISELISSSYGTGLTRYDLDVLLSMIMYNVSEAIKFISRPIPIIMRMRDGYMYEVIANVSLFMIYYKKYRW